jgi:hypothetical protein
VRYLIVLAASLTHSTRSTLGRVPPMPHGFRGHEHLSDESPHHLLDKLGIMNWSRRGRSSRLIELPKRDAGPRTRRRLRRACRLIGNAIDLG